MKTTIVWILAIVLCLSVFALAGCSSSEPAETESPTETETPIETGEPSGPISGGWNVSTDPASPVIPDEAKAAFDAATAGLMGVGYEPIGYLGSQVVAGTNYGFICRATTITGTPETKLCVMKVFRNLEGESEVLDIRDISIADYTTESDPDFAPALAGGWSIPSDLESAELPENVQKAFDTAFADFSGVGYHPIAYLGSQLVAGSNYAVLCNAIQVAPEQPSALAVVVIYADLEGSASVRSIAGFDFP